MLILLSVVLLTVSSCENTPAKIDISLDPDFSGMLEAIRGGDKSLDDKLGLIERAAAGGLADNSEALSLIQAFVASLDGSIEEKLGVLESAMESQAGGLETKIALVEEAFRRGFADLQSQQQLLLQAISSFSGSAEEKLAAVKSAVESQSSDISTKLAVIEAAVDSGIADSTDEYSLISGIIDGLGETDTDKLAAITAVVEGQSTDLSGKLALVEGAATKGFTSASTQRELIGTALGNLKCTYEQKKAAIEKAVQNQNRSLDTKLTLIEEAVKSGATDKDDALDLIDQALTTLGSSVDTKISAINTIITNQSTSLGTKVGLISSALSEGLLAEDSAISSLQTALDSSISDTDSDLSSAKTAILTSVSNLAGRVTPEELAKAFKGIKDAIDTHSQSQSEMLAAIQLAVDDLDEQLVKPVIAISHIGDPSYTIVKKQEIAVPLSVNPKNSVLSEAMMRLVVVESNQFFSGNGTEDNHFSIKSLEADTNTEGQYIVTLTADANDNVWDESILQFEYNYGTAQEPLLATTEAFQVTMMPNIDEGLKKWVYPYATFCATDTIYDEKGRRLVDTLGVIYYAFNQMTYTQKNSSATRTYTADNLAAASFVPNSGMPPVKATYNTYKIDEFKYSNPRFMSFCPDTTGSQVWRTFKDMPEAFMNVKGNISLTDKWGGTASVPVDINWASRHEKNITIDLPYNSQSIYEYAGDYYYDFNLYDVLETMGYYDNLLIALGEKKGMQHKELPLTQADRDEGCTDFFAISGGLSMHLMFDYFYSPGDRYRTRGYVRVKIMPDETSSGFDPRQLLMSYCITVNIVPDR